MRGTGVKQFNGLMKLGVNLLSNLKMELQMRASTDDKDYLHSSLSPYQYAYNTSRAIPCYNEDGTLAYYNKTQGYEFPLQYNVVNEMQHTGMNIEGTTLNFNANLLWEIIPGLRLTGALSYNRSNTDQKNGSTNNLTRLLSSEIIITDWNCPIVTFGVNSNVSCLTGENW